MGDERVRNWQHQLSSCVLSGIISVALLMLILFVILKPIVLFCVPLLSPFLGSRLVERAIAIALTLIWIVASGAIFELVRHLLTPLRRLP